MGCLMNIEFSARSGRALAAMVAMTVIVVAPGAAFANGFDLYGAGSRAAAMGGAAVSTASDFTAVHYNPAAMILGKSSTGGGLSMTFNNLGIRLADRPNGYGVPTLTSGGAALGDSHLLRPQRGTQELGNSYSGYVGGATNLGVERLRIGALAFLPIGGSATQLSTYNDERERLFTNQLNWDLIGGRVEHIVLEFGIAYKPLSWLSLGVGATYMPSATTNNYVYVPDASNMSDVDMNVELTLGTRLRPTAGVLIMPDDDVRIGIAFRDEQMLRVRGVTEIQVRGFEGTDDYPFFQPLNLTMQYSPRQFVAGGSWNFGPVLLSADITYAVWSHYPDHHGQRVNFSDVFIPRLGAEWEVVEGHLVRGGASWEPTPVGRQDGRTNYVDNDRLVASVGSGHAIEVNGHILELNWHAQVHFLVARTETKRALDSYPDCGPGVTSICDELPDDAINPSTGEIWPEAQGLQTGNPGFPGWSSGGWLASVGVDAVWNW